MPRGKRKGSRKIDPLHRLDYFLGVEVKNHGFSCLEEYIAKLIVGSKADGILSGDKEILKKYLDKRMPDLKHEIRENTVSTESIANMQKLLTNVQALMQIKQDRKSEQENKALENKAVDAEWSEEHKDAPERDLRSPDTGQPE